MWESGISFANDKSRAWQSKQCIVNARRGRALKGVEGPVASEWRFPRDADGLEAASRRASGFGDRSVGTPSVPTATCHSLPLSLPVCVRCFRLLCIADLFQAYLVVRYANDLEASFWRDRKLKICACGPHQDSKDIVPTWILIGHDTFRHFRLGFGALFPVFPIFLKPQHLACTTVIHVQLLASFTLRATSKFDST